MSPSPITPKAYAIHDIEKWTEFKVIDFKPKELGENDVEIAVHYCGVCASDVHTISGGWSKDIIIPMITGHEIAGVVNRVGSKVKEFKTGDRAGFGAQIGSCFECSRCKSDNENYCKTGGVDTYNAKYSDGQIAHGGYSSVVVGDQRFCFGIPDNVELKHACSMFCGGLTVFSPLLRNGCGPGKKVGIVGIGGLGHYAVIFAKAMGADKVVAFSHSNSKKQDALDMGADVFIATGDKAIAECGEDEFDIVLNTVDVAHAIPLNDLPALTKPNGKVLNVAIPEGPVEINMGAFAGQGAYFQTTHIGSKAECIQMMKLASEKNLKPWIQEFEMKDAGKAVANLAEDKKGVVRYRQVLRQDLVDVKAA